MKESYILTLEQCCKMFREVGIPMDHKRLADGIKAGLYPGRIIRTTATGRATYEIWRKDVQEFLAERCCPM